jgi:hypothetical protein
MKLLAVVITGLFLAPQQGKNANPDLKYDEKAGISVNKPPKNDEWDFKEKESGALWKDARFLVSHKVDELRIEIVQTPPSTQGGFDIGKQNENDFTSIKGTTGIDDAKQIVVKNQKLPGNGAGGVQASYMEMTYKRGEKLVEYRQWVFIGKENQCLYKAAVHGDEGMYKKHQKVADFILSSIRTWKLPK